MNFIAGRGRDGRAGGGRGGGGRSAGRTGGKGPPSSNEPNCCPVPPPLTEEKKPKQKMEKRALQLAAMEKKAEEEDKYFRQCLKDASESKHVKSGQQSAAKEKELFGTQGAQGIHFDKYKNIKVDVKWPGGVVAYNPLTNFNDLNTFHPQLVSNTERMNYKAATPIQQHAIPLAMQRNDLMCCAQTGSGKTCAFLLPVIAALVQETKISQQENAAAPRCVVLVPTRELASQIEVEAQKLTYGLDIRSVVVYGGVSARNQLRNLASGCDIVIATPGRLTDFCDRSIVSLSNVRYLVLDEADRMLDMGFCPQIRKLVERSGMKKERQTLMFSATFEKEIQKLAGDFLRSYVWIAVGRVGSTTESINQVIVKATHDKREKLKLVVEALNSGPSGRTLIFVQKKRSATWLKKQLQKGGLGDKNGNIQDPFTPIMAEDIHGDRSQSQREAALAKFRLGTCRVLVATDVAARGLDVSGIEHVINMDLPQSAEDFDSYVHRIGRTGRAGHAGLATSLFVPGEQGNGKIAEPMVAQLREAGQNVPDWLDAECCVGAHGGSKKSPFGGTDAREMESLRPKATGRGKNGGRNNYGGRGGRTDQSGRGSEQKKQSVVKLKTQDRGREKGESPMVSNGHGRGQGTIAHS